MFATAGISATQDNAEPLGPCSRRSGLVISEIMYHPTNRTDGLKVEFVELYNSNPWPEDISGFQLGGNVLYTNPPNTIIPGNGFLVVARNPTNVMAAYSVSNVLGPWVGGLPNNAGSVNLLSPAGAILLEVHYSDKSPWPASADGAGYSLMLARPSYGERDARAWQASALPGGSPGGPEPRSTNPLSGVMINEFLAFPSVTQPSFVELYNHCTHEVDLAGCVLRTDAAGGSAFVLSAGTTIPSGGFLSFTAGELGFNLAPAGGKLFLFSPGGARVLDSVRYDGQAQGSAFGRFPDGGSDFRSLSQATPGARNARPALAEVLINELIFGCDGGSAVELFNRSTNDVKIEGWAFTDGLKFTVPPHSVIPAGSYLVIGDEDAITEAAFLPGLSGQLSSSGEHIALSRPITLIQTNSSTGIKTTNMYFVPMDELVYGAGDRFGKWSDYRSPSLERTDLRADPRVPDVWADSAVVGGQNWVTLEQTGVLDLGVGSCDALQIMLLGPGEAMVDNIEVVAEDGANRVINGNFENGLIGWLPQGTHTRSTVESGAGSDGSSALHLRASGRGEPGPNGVRAALASPLTPGTRATIRAQVRLLRGSPEILRRLKGNYLEAFATLPFDSGGTPGYRNSRWATNMGPRFYDTTHRPILPAAGEPVTVTARVDDPDGVAEVNLWYRLDPATNWFRATMRDDGVGGDDVAGDAIFTGQIPGQLAGTMVAFYLEARDGFQPSAASHYPLDAPGRECLVRFGEADYPNPFGTYRFWMTQAARDGWASRDKLSNDPVPGTFVYGNVRAIYHAAARYNGSPETSASYDSPIGTLCGYDFLSPENEPVLGATQLTLDFAIHDPTGQREQLMHWFMEKAGLPYNHRRYVNVYINGIGQQERSGFGLAGTLYEDTQQPDSDLVREWFNDDASGTLLKGDDWKEFSVSGLIESSIPNTLEVFTSGGQKKTARYRWNWRPRSSTSSATDFAALFGLVDEIHVSGTNRLADCFGAEINLDNWMRTFAMNDLAANWDSFGNRAGKNTYHYRPPEGTWALLSWDFSTGLGVDDSPPNAPLFDVADPTLTRLYTVPSVLRFYWAGLDEALATFFNNASVDPWLDGRYQALAQTGMEDPAPIKAYVAQRKAFLQSQLAAVSSGWAITAPASSSTTVDSNYFILSGTAPFNVQAVAINGTNMSVNWTTLTNWSVALALTNGTNLFIVQARDRSGTVIPGTSNLFTIVFNALAASPFSNLVINEVFNYLNTPSSDFIEIYNRSETTAYDLGDATVQGRFYDPFLLGALPVSFSFLPGTVLAPKEFLIIVKSRSAFCQVFGAGARVAGEYAGSLVDPFTGGPSFPYGLTLSAGGFDLYFSAGYPWPEAHAGHSLQLIDPAQDHSRPGNWAVDTNAPPTPGTENSLRDDLPPFPLLTLNEILPWNVTNITNHAGQHEPWLEIYNAAAQPLALDGFQLSDDYQDPTRWHFPTGGIVAAGGLPLVWLDGEVQLGTSNEWHASFRATTNYGYVTMTRHVEGRHTWDLFIDWLRYGRIAGVAPDRSYGADATGFHFDDGYLLDYPTPGAPNVYTPPQPLPKPPKILVNEWMASNTRYPDPADGQFDDWFELRNITDAAIDLAGFWLTDNLLISNKFVVPSGYVIPPDGVFLVWADSQPAESRPDGDLHVNFKLAKSGDLIALFRPDGTLSDMVSFGQQTNDVSQGRCGADIVFFPQPTPRLPNSCADVPPFALHIVTFPHGALIWYPIEYHNAVIECSDQLGSGKWVALPDNYPLTYYDDELPPFIYFYDLTIDAGRQRFYRGRLTN